AHGPATGAAGRSVRRCPRGLDGYLPQIATLSGKTTGGILPLSARTDPRPTDRPAPSASGGQTAPRPRRGRRVASGRLGVEAGRPARRFPGGTTRRPGARRGTHL